MSNARQDATYLHASPLSPQIRRFVGIEPASVSGRSVNAEMLQWAGLSDGYTPNGRKVLVRGLDAAAGVHDGPDAGVKFLAIWMNDTKTWERFEGGGTSGGGYIAKTGGSPVPAMTGVTPGKAIVTIHEIDEDDELVATTETITAYNVASTQVSANKVIQVKREGRTGKYIIDFEDCD